MTESRSRPTRADAVRLDQSDPLAGERKHFALPSGVIYLDGNSLGALPRSVPDAVGETLRQWGEDLISGWWDDGWWAAPERVGDRIGGLLGAAPGQTVVGDSTSVQLFNALTAAARLRDGRRTVLVDREGFPTDRYLAASVGRLLGLTVREVPMAGLAEEIRATGDDLAVVAASAVDYRSGELHDLAAFTEAAHDAGAVVLWDVCHAAGALPLAFDALGVDFAVGCGYKFLSGGPGAPAFLYVNARHHERFDQPLTGWHGHAEPFAATAGYRPAAGIAQARIGTPPILSLLALEAALDVFDHVDLAAVRAKSLSLTDFFIACADARLSGLGFEVVTPREHRRRGSQVTLRHPDAEAIMTALAGRGVLGDVRPPNLLRFGFNGLYVSHVDAFDAVAAIEEVS
ncbi:kynureninase [Amycolatopsis silviterrae]|uniref:Kynureninase n=1 Tax=Amycolatopsis silviterrae TaxID=1656914 RepID=A0ABW5H2I5_9PSEU